MVDRESGIIIFPCSFPISAVLVAKGEASGGTESSAIQRWTSGLHYTEPGDDGMETSYGGSNGELWEDQRASSGNGGGGGSSSSTSGMKSTRHLPQSSTNNNKHGEGYHHRNSYRVSTSATLQVYAFTNIMEEGRERGIMECFI